MNSCIGRTQHIGVHSHWSSLDTGNHWLDKGNHWSSLDSFSSLNGILNLWTSSLAAGTSSFSGILDLCLAPGVDEEYFCLKSTITSFTYGEVYPDDLGFRGDAVEGERGGRGGSSADLLATVDLVGTGGADLHSYPSCEGMLLVLCCQ